MEQCVATVELEGDDAAGDSLGNFGWQNIVNVTQSARMEGAFFSNCGGLLIQAQLIVECNDSRCSVTDRELSTYVDAGCCPQMVGGA
jgi:hypothetical protein